jgi:hypothetical protein
LLGRRHARPSDELEASGRPPASRLHWYAVAIARARPDAAAADRPNRSSEVPRVRVLAFVVEKQHRRTFDADLRRLSHAVIQVVAGRGRGIPNEPRASIVRGSRVTAEAQRMARTE